MEILNEINYVAIVAAIISLMALVLNFVIYRKSKKEYLISVEHQLTDHFLNIDDLLVKFPHLSDAYKEINNPNNIFSRYDKTIVAFVYKHLNIFSEVYNIYFKDLSDQEVAKRRKNCSNSEYWYNFIQRSFCTNTLLKQIAKEIIADNPNSKDYSEGFQKFMKNFFL